MTTAIELPFATKRLIVAGTMLGLLLAGSSQTIISTALPTIVGDLGGLNLISWVFTGYMLSSTTIVPITGKVSDIYGRKPFFMGGIVIFMAASIAAGFSQSMEQLIVMRAIQGVGGGMLMSCVFAIIGDLFPPEERGRWQGFFISGFGVASILGPTLGGAITDYVDWRGIFYINLPFGLLALAIVGTKFPNLQRPDVKVSIDFLGVAVLSGTLVCLLLALAWGGDVYAWRSTEIVSLLAAAAAGFVLFLIVELNAKEPVIPLHLFKNRIFAVASALTFVSGISLLGVLTFMPLFLQGVLGASATSSGLVLSPMMISVMIASNGGGYVVQRTQRYRTIIVSGTAVLLGGMFVLSRFSASTTWPEAIFGMALVGFGIGLAVPVINLSVQNAFSRRYLGVATASSQFFRQIGGTLGIAVFSTLVVTGLGNNLDRNLPAEVTETVPPSLAERLHDSEVLLREEGRKGLEPAFLELGDEGTRLFDLALSAIKTSLADAVADIFLVAFIVAIVALALAAMMPERVTSQEEPVTIPEPPQQPAAAVAPTPTPSAASALVANGGRGPRLGWLAVAGGGVVALFVARRLFNNHHRLE
jgi:EmrB/QacA subfamily drug resistance transporter